MANVIAICNFCFTTVQAKGKTIEEVTEYIKETHNCTNKETHNG